MTTNPPPPMLQYLHPEDILMPLCSNSVEDTICRLVRHIHTRHGGFDPESAISAVEAREKVMPVIMERELAMPHARLSELTRPLLAVGVCPAGIPMSPPADPVKVVVLTLIPSGDPNLYLRILAAITKALRTPQAIARIATARNPGEVLAVLGISPEHLPDVLTVRHVMNGAPQKLRNTDTLGAAIELFCANQLMDIPVVDPQNNILGTIAVEDLLRLCLPVHLRWMEDLSPILRFEPFAELVKRDSGMPLTHFIRQDILSIGPEVPAIQLTKLFLQDERRQVVVVEDKRLVGTVDLHAFVRKLFWD
ncbi:MAG: PTS sugar transporter subunit IIA [Kiritimatiellia bacterium]